ncbi:hypothetical protein [Paraflavitalea pollutisoli]|uniref:hypothetical protein n=1 Tax=Paraflavitalea pollutisoli TaxID=3034143 RepID=UPI0023EAF604|nr:hypothetical protein [Paraflavitalea sp. H1-2-19X]
MNTTLTPKLQDELRLSFEQIAFSVEAAVAKLKLYGYEETVARELIDTEYRAFKQELFEQIEERRKMQEHQKIASIAIVMIAVIGPLFGIASMAWYVCAAGLAAIAGYLGFQSRPIAAIAGAIAFTILFPMTHDFYFEGRTRFLRIELFMPMLFAAVPALILYFILSRTVYAHVDD